MLLWALCFPEKGFFVKWKKVGSCHPSVPRGPPEVPGAAYSFLAFQNGGLLWGWRIIVAHSTRDSND